MSWLAMCEASHRFLQLDDGVETLCLVSLSCLQGAALQNMGWHLGPVSWRPTTVKWRQFSQSNRHSTIGTRQIEYHDALPSSANDDVRCDCTFADDGNASWHLVCRMPMVEWRLDCENCRHLTVVGLHDTGPLFHWAVYMGLSYGMWVWVWSVYLQECLPRSGSLTFMRCVWLLWWRERLERKNKQKTSSLITLLSIPVELRWQGLGSQPPEMQ